MSNAQRIRSLARSPLPAVVMVLRDISMLCGSLAEASEVYCALRDESGEGSSTFPDGLITTARGDKYRVSYNGRVWGGWTYVPRARPVAL